MPTEHNVRKRTKRNQKILKEYNEGKSSRQLRKKYKLSHQGVIDVIKQEGGTLHPVGTKKKLSAEDETYIRFLYEKGFSYKKIMAKYNVSSQIVYTSIRRAGGSPTKRKFTDEQEQQLKQIYEEGISSYRITETCGYSNSTIRNAIRRAGGTIRSTRRKQSE